MRHNLHASDNLELGPKQISGVDHVFHVRYLNIKPTQVTAQPFSMFVEFTLWFPPHTAQHVRESRKAPELPNPRELAKGTNFNPVS